jgi:hypothetical protein
VARLTLLLFLAAAPSEWTPGAFRGVVTGETHLDAARRTFGAPIDDVPNPADEKTRRVTFRPIAVEVSAGDGGTSRTLQVGVQMFLEQRTGRVLRIRLTPWPTYRATESHVALTVWFVDRQFVKQIVDVPFTERRVDYCEAGGSLWGDGIFTHGDPPPLYYLLAPEHGIVVHLRDRKYVEDIVFSAAKPDWIESNPCPTMDVGHAL